MKKVIIYQESNYWIAKCLETSEKVKERTRKEAIKKIKDRVKGILKEIKIPNCKKFKRGIEKYENCEKRDFVYKVASYWIQKFWCNPGKIAEGLGIFVLIWNQAFYRGQAFDIHKLKEVLKKKREQIKSFRKREICSLKETDEDRIRELFEALLKSFKVSSGKNKGKRSPVSVAKALHLLAPKFFPLWDRAIAERYGCHRWGERGKDSAKKYVEFCKILHILAKLLRKCATPKDRTLIKLIDEYNYARYSKAWIKDC